MTRRKPFPQVEISVSNPDEILRDFKARGGKGFKMRNKNLRPGYKRSKHEGIWEGWDFTIKSHLWLTGTEEQIKKMIPSAKIIRSVGQ